MRKRDGSLFSKNGLQWLLGFDKMLAGRRVVIVEKLEEKQKEKEQKEMRKSHVNLAVVRKSGGGSA